MYKTRAIHLEVSKAVFDKLKKLRLSSNKTQQEIAEVLGITKAAYSNYEKGKRKIPISSLKVLAEYYHISMDKLTFDEPENTLPAGKSSYLKIPIIGNCAAGTECFAENNICGYEIADVSSILHGYQYCYLRVQGDSMEPTLSEGDLVLVRLQSDVDSGDIAVVLVRDEGSGDYDGLVKRVKKDNQDIILLSENRYYPPRRFSGEALNRIRIFGRVMEMKRKF